MFALTMKVLCAGLLVMAAACGNDTEDPATQATTLLAPPSELHDFQSLEDMVATSTAVIEGEVVAVEPGRKVGGEHGIQFEQATILVHRVLAGTVASDSIVLELEGWDSDGNRVVLPYELAPNREGDRGVYFVWQKREPTPEPRYRLVNSQGRFLEAAPGVAVASRHDALTARLAAMGPAGLRAAVQTAPRRAPSPAFVEMPAVVELR